MAEINNYLLDFKNLTNIIEDQAKKLKKEIEEVKSIAKDVLSQFNSQSIIKLEDIQGQNNQCIPEKLLKKQGYQSILSISGDGNCLYRAFMINFLLQIFSGQDREKTKQFIQKVYNIDDILIDFGFDMKYHNKINKQAIKFCFLDYLAKWYQQLTQQPNKNQFLQQTIFDNIKEKNELDMSMIIICKNLILKTYLDVSTDPNNSENKAIDEETTNEMISQIKLYGEFAQGFCISCIPQTFSTKLSIVLYDQKKDILIEQPFGFDQPLLTNQNEIHLLLSHLHYYILFKKTVYEMNLKKYKNQFFENVMEKSVLQ